MWEQIKDNFERVDFNEENQKISLSVKALLTQDDADVADVADVDVEAVAEEKETEVSLDVPAEA